ncbi:hypothetical protein BCV70DRAFT_107489 [Testicularia cyperi]|uniref:PH domain-containing protein n=1 Tax=Testicularia cyperi TaxID=1882483 RepID=A0A317XPS6_9BASI|nr:hypothetical protein BCV70DRAFT_107489 [Testicularia cyperi]
MDPLNRPGWQFGAPSGQPGEIPWAQQLKPKAVSDIASSTVPPRRPSLGIDEEQNVIEAVDESAGPPTASATTSQPNAQVNLLPNGALNVQSTGVESTHTFQHLANGNDRIMTTRTNVDPSLSSGDTIPVRHSSSSRSNRALSQLPRLNSMRAIGGTRPANGVVDATSARTRDGSNGSGHSAEGVLPEDTSEEDQEMSDEEEAEGGDTTDYHDAETETDDDVESDDDGDTSSPTASRQLDSTPMSFSGSAGGLNRANRPTPSLVLPPAPTFVPKAAASSTLTGDAAGTSVSASSPDVTPAAEQDFHQVVGRGSWTNFNATGLTPFETPTPSISNGAGAAAAAAFGLSGRTPRARQEQSESSYFAARPGTGGSRPLTSGSMTGEAPPPSPSIISRSRAPSSASMRNLRTPGTAGSGPVPNRSMPSPATALPPINLARQISSVSGVSRNGYERSKSPARNISVSRPSTSGTLTPQQAGGSADRTASRDGSMERPASERNHALRPASASTSTVPSPTTAKAGVNSSHVAARLSGVLHAAAGSSASCASSARPNFYAQKSVSLVDLLGPASRRLDLNGEANAASASAAQFASAQSVTSSEVATSTDQANAATTTPGTVAGSSDAAAAAAATTADGASVATVTQHKGEPTITKPTSGLPQPSDRVPSYHKKDQLAPIATGLAAAAGLPSPGPLTAGLSRRRSMFEMRAEPPPYSIIHNRPEGPQVILPREEEGKEKLPEYCCGVHIEGYLPRKMEFAAPGVQAKDRSWKRQYFVLHGTSLRVYKNDLSVEKYASSGMWGEMKGAHVHFEPLNEDGSNGGSSLGLGQVAREAISHTPLGGRNSYTDSSKYKDGATSFDGKNGLLRNYTLQGAESGLAADYLKRRHVVRVRAEGEQFLLQTRSDRHVVDWIEALQAATNVSMDLEKRQMPKFITLPRRRRRRRRNADGTTTTAEEQETRDIQEAQRRSIAEQGGSTNGNGRRSSTATYATPRHSISMSARPSMSIENDMDPSAAFEQMLREDQEEIRRRSAADI